MAIQITHKNQQAKGVFDGGAILENKPIGFPQDGGTQQPYSNLFYWANAWSDNGGLIDKHPHKMFEIMSFVLSGEIQHYDSQMDSWLALHKGDAQIIRSGSGITHAERLMKGGRMFQIWFDPNIRNTMNKPATYNDYKVEDMKYYQENGILYKNYIGNGGPVQMDTEGVEINELSMPKGSYQLKLNDTKIYSFYLIKGSVKLNENQILTDDFIKIEAEKELNFDVASKTTLFCIALQKKLTYKTYLEIVNT